MEFKSAIPLFNDKIPFKNQIGFGVPKRVVRGKTIVED